MALTRRKFLNLTGRAVGAIAALPVLKLLAKPNPVPAPQGELGQYENVRFVESSKPRSGSGQVWGTNSRGGYMYSQKLSNELRTKMMPHIKYRQFSRVRR